MANPVLPLAQVPSSSILYGTMPSRQMVSVDPIAMVMALHDMLLNCVTLPGPILPV
jgi:hypothetical protein